MALGTNRTRNWGKESQQIALEILLKSRRVAYLVKRRRFPHLVEQRRDRELWLAPSHNGITLPFLESVAILANVGRGRWHAESIIDGRTLATGVSERDVIRATIQVVWY